MAHEAQRWTAGNMNVGGDTYVVTGANSGLGYETSLALARGGANVVMMGRSEQKLVGARDRIAGEIGTDTRLHPYAADMASLQTVRDIGSAIAREHTPIRGLILNAGVMQPPERTTPAGHEIHMGVNLLAPAVLLDTLGPAIPDESRSAIVFVGSSGEKFVRGDIDLIKQYRFRAIAYNLSKKALHAYAEALRGEMDLTKLSIRNVVAEPGMTRTGLFDNPGLLPRIVGNIAAGSRPPFIAARSILRAATDMTLESGAFIGPDKHGPPVHKRPARQVTQHAYQFAVWQAVTTEAGLNHNWIRRSQWAVEG